MIKKEYKQDCGFRRYLRLCDFRIEQCRPPKEGDDYGDCCHLYPIDWNIKSMKSHGKSLSEDILRLERTLKSLKENDKPKYRETKKIIKDMFNGLVCISKAITFIKRTGGGLDKKRQRVADKLMTKLKDKKDGKRKD